MTTRTRAGIARSLIPRLSLRRLAAGLARFDAAWRARRHLAELDDRALRDIGVTRADIAEELRRPLPWRSLF